MWSLYVVISARLIDENFHTKITLLTNIAYRESKNNNWIFKHIFRIKFYVDPEYCVLRLLSGNTPNAFAFLHKINAFKF